MARTKTPASRTSESSEGRMPNPVDAHVGRQIRTRRKILGLSQERLAGDLRLTFQQVQKYERGANRVSASKLYEVARTLQAPISYFFEGLADPVGDRQPGVADAGSDQFVHDFLMTPEGLDMAEHFPRIRSPRARRKILELVRALAEAPDEDEG